MRKPTVSKKLWKRWSKEAREAFVTFNCVNQGLMKHPKMTSMKHEYWDTIRWNLAFMVASHINDYEKKLKEKVIRLFDR